MDNFYDRDGRPIDIFKWQKLTHDADYDRVAFTELMDTEPPHRIFEIRTVWVGLPRGSDPYNGRPLIFATYIHEEGYVPDPNVSAYRHGYATEKEAREGHSNIVRMHTRVVAINDEQWGSNHD